MAIGWSAREQSGQIPGRHGFSSRSIMKKNRRGGWFACALVIAALWHQHAFAQGQPNRQAPNVVVIVVDDLGYGDLGCYGSKEIRTPAVDRLAKEGVRLADCYANGAVCSPTRAALMTGRYPQRAGFDWAIGYGQRGKGLAASETSVARMMRGAGYRTALFGKWHLGYGEAFSPIAHGFDEFFGFVAADLDYYGHKEATGERGLYEGNKLVDRPGYMTDLIAERALAFIDKNAAGPFFLEVAFNAPHFPFQPPGKPDDVRTTRNYGPQNGTRADYIQMVEHLDLRIGEILRSLDDHKLTAKTLVVFVDDNGGERLSSNGPMSGYKGTLWEGGIRVPCMIRWPGVIPAGNVSHQVVMTMDLTAMILSACGVAPPAGRVLDGEDLLPILTGKAPERERTLFWRIRHPAYPTAQKAVRRGRWKYLTDGRAELLFDLQADLGEASNLADQKPKILGELKKALSDWEQQMPPETSPARPR
jgi:arylsulfatase A-like enzyme